MSLSTWVQILQAQAATWPMAILCGTEPVSGLAAIRALYPIVL